jgi:hypothetical protein
MRDKREVWFIKAGHLYEVATYKALDTWLAQIVQTWQFILFPPPPRGRAWWNFGAGSSTKKGGQVLI